MSSLYMNVTNVKGSVLVITYLADVSSVFVSLRSSILSIAGPRKLPPLNANFGSSTNIELRFPVCFEDCMAP